MAEVGETKYGSMENLPNIGKHGKNGWKEVQENISLYFPSQVSTN